MNTLIRYIFALSLSVIVGKAAAQVGEHRSDFAIGANAGVTMNTMNFQPTIKQSQLIAPTFGLTARYISEKYFTTICGVQLELNYANLGWKELIEDGSGNTFHRNHQYIQMPILMQLGWGYEQKGCKFLFEAGPQFGYNFGMSEVYGGGEWNTSHRPNYVVGQYGMEVDNKFDYGIAGGLGVELSTGIGHFLLEARYYYGLSDVFSNSKKAYFARSANQTISARFTYLFDIVKTQR